MTARARSKTRAAVAVAAAGTWLGIAACELVLPTHELSVVEPVDAGPADAGADAGAPPPLPPPPDTCNHRYPPPPPDLPVNEDAGTVDLLFAVKSLSLSGDTSVSSTRLGLDLDHTCTCPGPPSCHPPLPGLDDNCDEGDDGRDLRGNTAFGEVLETVLKQAPAGDIDQRIAVGLLSYLIQIRHYKPGPGARRVFVAYYDSSGLLSPGDSGVARTSPTWNGGEAWALDCALSQTSGCPQVGELIGDAPLIPGFRDPEAYITESDELVAHISPLVLGFSLATMRLTDVTIDAKLTIAADGSVTQLDGQIAGRFTKDDVFTTVSMLRNTTDTATLCPGTPEFDTIRHQICQKLDLPSGPGFTSEVCDALSFAIPFTALPAKFGYRVDHVVAPRGCDASVSCN